MLPLKCAVALVVFFFFFLKLLTIFSPYVLCDRLTKSLYIFKCTIKLFILLCFALPFYIEINVIYRKLNIDFKWIWLFLYRENQIGRRIVLYLCPKKDCPKMNELSKNIHFLLKEIHRKPPPMMVCETMEILIFSSYICMIDYLLHIGSGTKGNKIQMNIHIELMNEWNMKNQIVCKNRTDIVCISNDIDIKV